jgi:hypothetical protein
VVQMIPELVQRNHCGRRSSTRLSLTRLPADPRKNVPGRGGGVKGIHEKRAKGTLENLMVGKQIFCYTKARYEPLTN